MPKQVIFTDPEGYDSGVRVGGVWFPAKTGVIVDKVPAGIEGNPAFLVLDVEPAGADGPRSPSVKRKTKSSKA